MVVRAGGFNETSSAKGPVVRSCAAGGAEAAQPYASKAHNDCVSAEAEGCYEVLHSKVFRSLRMVHMETPLMVVLRHVCCLDASTTGLLPPTRHKLCDLTLVPTL